MHPVLEYRGSVWDPSDVGLQNELERVQNGAARFVTGNYNYETGCMAGIFLNIWNRNLPRNGGETVDSYYMLYKCLKGKASIPTDDIIPLVRCCKNHHSLVFQVPIVYTKIFIQSSRVITIIFTTETSTSYGISLGTDLYLLKFIIMKFTLSDTDSDSRWRNAFFTHFYSLKRQTKSSDKMFTNKNFQLAVNRYAHCRTGKSREISCAMNM